MNALEEHVDGHAEQSEEGQHGNVQEQPPLSHGDEAIEATATVRMYHEKGSDQDWRSHEKEPPSVPVDRGPTPGAHRYAVLRVD